MKTKITIIVSLIVSLAVGFLAGKFQASSSWSQLYAHNVYQRAAGDAAFFATVLTDLRGGRQDDGLNMLERSLDGSLLSVAPDHIPAAERTKPIESEILQAQAYRPKYPRHEP